MSLLDECCIFQYRTQMNTVCISTFWLTVDRIVHTFSFIEHVSQHLCIYLSSCFDLERDITAKLLKRARTTKRHSRDGYTDLLQFLCFI